MNRTEQAANKAAQTRHDTLVGSVLRQWAAMDGDAGEAGKRLVNAVSVMMMGVDSPTEDALNDAAEWLRLASLSMDKAANWPDNGR